VSGKESAMFSPLHIFLYLLVAVYVIAGIVVLRLALRPSCRICLNRHDCPRRLRGAARFTLLPFCTRTGNASTSPKPAITNPQSADLA
jgi:hypothetical protein